MYSIDIENENTFVFEYSISFICSLYIHIYSNLLIVILLFEYFLINVHSINTFFQVYI